MPAELHAMAQGTLNAARQIVADTGAVPLVALLWNGTSSLLPVCSRASSIAHARARAELLAELRGDALEHLARWAVLCAPGWTAATEGDLLLYCESESAAWTGRASVHDGVLQRIVFASGDRGLGLWPLLPDNLPTPRWDVPIRVMAPA